MALRNEALLSVRYPCADAEPEPRHMFAIFLTPAYAPFAIAFVVMIGIGLIEAIGLGLGRVVSSLLRMT